MGASALERVTLRVLGWFAVLLCCLVTSNTFGQIPTPEQMQLLNTLPPAQRQALLQQYQNFQNTQSQILQPSQSLVPQGEMLPQTDPALDGTTVEESEGPPRLGPGSTIVVNFTLPEEDVTLDQQQMLERLSAANPFTLDDSGHLYLPGLPSVALGGLTAAEAQIRLEVDAALGVFNTMTVTLLPLQVTGVEGLERFGYTLFSSQTAPFGFQPPFNMPVPAEYLLGPGDLFNVQLFGNTNAEYNLMVSREGFISFPQIGPIVVAGLDFPSARDTINQRITEQMIGVRPSITLGQLRTIRVFVLGEVEAPGSYSVSGLSTMTNALLQSRGVTEIGSLRDIQLKRSGDTVTTLDLYDLLLRGDTSSDARLQPGDVLFVSPVGDTVAINGAVKRPAIYELTGNETVTDIVALAGGLTADADATRVRLERVVPGRGTTVEELDIRSSPETMTVRNGDQVQVLRNLDQLENVVQLEGNVHRPGRYQWVPGLRLSDLLPTPELLKPMSDTGYVLIRREVEANVLIEVRSADLGAAMATPGGPADPLLQPRDTIHVFNLEIGRQHVVAPVVEQLRAQVPTVQVVTVASVFGSVRAAGEYPLEPGMRISDLIRAGGGLSESAYTLEAELTRYVIVDGEYRATELVVVNLADVLRGDQGADLFLNPHDSLNIREIPRWGEQETVELGGEFLFPGIYTIRQGETLASVVERAGGLTELAFPEGAIYLRQELRDREGEQLATLATRIQADLASLSLSDPGASQAVSIGQSLITQLQEAEPLGRMVVNLERILAGDDAQDIVLEGGDQILVPDRTQSVTVLGEVQVATSHLHEDGLRQEDYLQRSGGLSANADGERIYIVRANGQVVLDQGSRWFNRSADSLIEAGDTIVVPLDTDRVRPLVFWTSATSVIYNLAVAVAAISGL